MVTEDDIYYYVIDLIMNSGVRHGHPNSFIDLKVKNVKLHSIKPYRFNNTLNIVEKYIVQYSVEVYQEFNEGFTPLSGKWIQDSIIVDVSKIEVSRDIKINRLLNDPDK